MLPPVQSASNAHVSYQENRQGFGRDSQAAAQVYGQPPVLPAGVEASAAAAKLNILLLAGQEGISANLIAIADLIGRTLGVPRKENETNSGYAARLMAALAKLPPGELARVERQLSRAFNGVQLRMIIEAFQNPAGPEAARLTVFLELSRYKDRDLAARTVVTSYRQYAGEPRPPTTALPALISRAESSSAQPSVSAQPYAGTGAGKPVPTGAAALPPGGVAAESSVHPPAAATQGIPISQVPTGDNAHATVAGSAQELATGADAAVPTAENAALAAGETGAADPEVRILQDRLRQTFEVGHGEVDGVRDDINADTVARLAQEPNEADGGAAREERRHSDENSSLPSKQTAASQGRHAAEKSASRELPTQFVLRGWTDVTATRMLEYAAVPDKPIMPEEAASTELPLVAADAARDAPMPVRVRDGQSAFSERAAEDIEDNAARLAHAAREHPQPARAPMLADAELALLRQATMPQGLPFPVINYLIAPEYGQQSEVDDAGRRFDGEDRSEDEEAKDGFSGSADQESHSEENLADDDEADVSVRNDALANDAEAATSVADRATDLYWRMAGWS